MSFWLSQAPIAVGLGVVIFVAGIVFIAFLLMVFRDALTSLEGDLHDQPEKPRPPDHLTWP